MDFYAPQTHVATIPPPSMPDAESCSAWTPGVARAARRQIGAWRGLSAEVTELHGPGPHLENLRSDKSQMLIMLEQVGGQVETRARPDRPTQSDYGGSHHLSFVPAGTPVWEHTGRIRYSRRLRLLIDASAIDAHFPEPVAWRGLPARLMFEDRTIWRCAEMLATECETPGDYSQIYGESLAVALLVSIVRCCAEVAARDNVSRLAPWQLRRVTDHIENHAAERLQLTELARLIGLSASHFGRAFRASTGIPPHRWHTQARVRQAQTLLLDDRMPIAEIALALGFSDQSHFTNAFRNVTGLTPGRWQRTRRA